jgi:hypothetical protein
VSLDVPDMLSMSVFEASRSLRRQRQYHQDLDIVELVNVVSKTQGGACDFKSGASLSELITRSVVPDDATDFYRACIETLIDSQLIWLRTVLLGRTIFIQKLPRDAEQCFRAAGLLEDPPSSNVVDWWDRMADRARIVSDRDKMVRARTAERLSLNHEIKRLKEMGVLLSPVWMAIEDNTAGYDILSYDPGQFEPISRLIEVKSTISKPIRFYLTRHEWETALKFGDRYFFHVWDLSEPQMYEFKATDFLESIPTDNADGKWADVIISIIS